MHESHHIHKFKADGQFLTAIGSKPLQLSSPSNIAFNANNGKVYVATIVFKF